MDTSGRIELPSQGGSAQPERTRVTSSRDESNEGGVLRKPLKLNRLVTGGPRFVCSEISKGERTRPWGGTGARRSERQRFVSPASKAASCPLGLGTPRVPRDERQGVGGEERVWNTPAKPVQAALR